MTNPNPLSSCCKAPVNRHYLTCDYLCTNCSHACSLDQGKTYPRDFSHSHCWHQKTPACGIPLEKHTQCCLCDVLYDQGKVNASTPPRCEEDVYAEDFGYVSPCGGEYTRIGTTNLYQCEECKKVIEHT